MSEVSLTLIQTFYLVARHGSYSAASRELNITYQSAANHVRRLEQIIQARLVESEQGAKRIVLTPRGRSLYNLLHPELDIMLERLSLIVERDRSLVRIGLPQAIFYYLASPVLKEFRDQFPDAEIIAYERDTVLAELVKNGSLDVCVSERYFGDPVVPQRLLGTYGLSLVYPASWGKEPRPEEVPDWARARPFVAHEPGQTLRNIALDFLNHNGVDLAPAIATSGSSSVMRCVEEGLGFAILPSWCIDPDDDRLRSVTLDQLQRVKVYFGEAQYLERNIYVMALFDIFRKQLAANPHFMS